MPYLIAFSLKTIFQIVYQTIFLFMILWMTLFHDRWQNSRDFIERNYSSQSLIYLCGFIIIFSLVVTIFGRDLNRAVLGGPHSYPRFKIIS